MAALVAQTLSEARVVQAWSEAQAVLALSEARAVQASRGVAARPRRPGARRSSARQPESERFAPMHPYFQTP